VFTALRIVLPALRNSILSSVMFVTILSMGVFTVPSLLGGERDTINPLAKQIYNDLFAFPVQMQRATAIGTMLALICLAGFYLYQRATRKAAQFVSITGKGDARRPQRLPWVARSFSVIASVYFFVTIVLPLAALTVIALTPARGYSIRRLEFTLENVRIAFADQYFVPSLVNTLILTVTVPLICVAFGGIIVYFTERIHAIGTRALGYLAGVPIAIPGLIFCTGVMIAWIATPLYATRYILIMALVAGYLPYAIRILGNGLAQVSPSLEESAQLNGADRARVGRTILLPLLRPSVVSVLVLISIFTLREIDAAILLSAPGKSVLGVLAWNYSSEGNVQVGAVFGIFQTVLLTAGVVGATAIDRFISRSRGSNFLHSMGGGAG
jgi:iron(III) transport system permease protein